MTPAFSTKLKKVFAAFVAVVFTSSSVLAQPPASQNLAGQFDSRSAHIGLARDLDLPKEAGEITSIFIPQNSDKKPFLFHIQDIHANESAQKKISGILEVLANNYDVKSFGFEGANSVLKPSVLRFADNPETNFKIANYLVRKGQLTGGEYFALKKSEADLNKNGFRFEGIENAEQYIRDLKIFKRSLSNKDSLDEIFKSLQLRINRFKSAAFNRDLARFDKIYQSYESREEKNLLSIYKEVQAKTKSVLGMDLLNARNQTQYPQMVRMANLIQSEKTLRADQVQTDIQRILTSLKDSGSAKTELARFTQMLEKMMNNQMTDCAPYASWRECFESLRAFMGSNHLKWTDYPNFRSFAMRLILQEEMMSMEMFDEMDRLIYEIEMKMAEEGSPLQKEIIQLASDVKLLNRFLNLEASRTDVDKARSQKVSLIESVKTRLISLEQSNKESWVGPEESDLLQSQYELANLFYQGAQKRETSFVDHVLEMSKNGNHRVAFVTGGYHSQGIREELERRGIAYATITPKLSGDESLLVKEFSELYEQGMLGKQSNIFEKSKIVDVLKLVSTEAYLKLDGRERVRVREFMEAIINEGVLDLVQEIRQADQSIDKLDEIAAALQAKLRKNEVLASENVQVQAVDNNLRFSWDSYKSGYLLPSDGLVKLVNALNQVPVVIPQIAPKPELASARSLGIIDRINQLSLRKLGVSLMLGAVLVLSGACTVTIGTQREQQKVEEKYPELKNRNKEEIKAHAMELLSGENLKDKIKGYEILTSLHKDSAVKSSRSAVISGQQYRPRIHQYKNSEFEAIIATVTVINIETRPYWGESEFVDSVDINAIGLLPVEKLSNLDGQALQDSLSEIAKKMDEALKVGKTPEETIQLAQQLAVGRSLGEGPELSRRRLLGITIGIPIANALRGLAVAATVGATACAKKEEAVVATGGGIPVLDLSQVALVDDNQTSNLSQNQPVTQGKPEQLTEASVTGGSTPNTKVTKKTGKSFALDFDHNSGRYSGITFSRNNFDDNNGAIPANVTVDDFMDANALQREFVFNLEKGKTVELGRLKLEFLDDTNNKAVWELKNINWVDQPNGTTQKATVRLRLDTTNFQTNFNLRRFSANLISDNPDSETSKTYRGQLTVIAQGTEGLYSTRALPAVLFNETSLFINPVVRNGTPTPQAVLSPLAGASKFNDVQLKNGQLGITEVTVRAVSGQYGGTALSANRNLAGGIQQADLLDGTGFPGRILKLNHNFTGADLPDQAILEIISTDPVTKKRVRFRTLVEDLTQGQKSIQIDMSDSNVNPDGFQVNNIEAINTIYQVKPAIPDPVTGTVTPVTKNIKAEIQAQGYNASEVVSVGTPFDDADVSNLGGAIFVAQGSTPQTQVSGTAPTYTAAIQTNAVGDISGFEFRGNFNITSAPIRINLQQIAGVAGNLPTDFQARFIDGSGRVSQVALPVILGTQVPGNKLGYTIFTNYPMFDQLGNAINKSDIRTIQFVYVGDSSPRTGTQQVTGQSLGQSLNLINFNLPSDKNLPDAQSPKTMGELVKLLEPHKLRPEPEKLGTRERFVLEELMLENKLTPRIKGISAFKTRFSPDQDISKVTGEALIRILIDLKEIKLHPESVLTKRTSTGRISRAQSLGVAPKFDADLDARAIRESILASPDLTNGIVPLAAKLALEYPEFTRAMIEAMMAPLVAQVIGAIPSAEAKLIVTKPERALERLRAANNSFAVIERGYGLQIEIIGDRVPSEADIVSTIANLKLHPQLFVRLVYTGTNQAEMLKISSKIRNTEDFSKKNIEDRFEVVLSSDQKLKHDLTELPSLVFKAMNQSALVVKPKSQLELAEHTTVLASSSAVETLPMAYTNSIKVINDVTDVDMPVVRIASGHMAVKSLAGLAPELQATIKGKTMNASDFLSARLEQLQNEIKAVIAVLIAA